MLSWTRAEPPEPSFCVAALPRTHRPHWMEMKTRLLFLPLLLMLVASLTACGGGSIVPPSAVAVVGGVPITTAAYNAALAQAQAQLVAQGGQQATPGSPQYTTMRNQ